MIDDALAEEKREGFLTAVACVHHLFRFNQYIK